MDARLGQSLDGAALKSQKMAEAHTGQSPDAGAFKSRKWLKRTQGKGSRVEP
jgi:hypothetical protein